MSAIYVLAEPWQHLVLFHLPTILTFQYQSSIGVSTERAHCHGVQAYTGKSLVLEVESRGQTADDPKPHCSFHGSCNLEYSPSYDTDTLFLQALQRSLFLVPPHYILGFEHSRSRLSDEMGGTRRTMAVLVGLG